MITAGIDVGFENSKVVILRDGTVVAKCCGPSGGAKRAEAIETLWQEALQIAGISKEDVESVVSTGIGKFNVPFKTKQKVEAVANAYAARHLFPNSTSVVDIGANQTLVVTLGEENMIIEATLNQKCGACIGLFMESIARRLGMTLTELSSLPKDAAKGVTVDDSCRVFAEMDVLGLMNRGIPPRKIAGAVVNAAAVKANNVFNDKRVPSKETTVLGGGVARNWAFVKALEDRSGIRFLIPEEPEYITALGAALIAAG